MSSSTAFVDVRLDEAGQLDLAIAIVYAKRRRRTMISQARAPVSFIQTTSAHVIAEVSASLLIPLPPTEVTTDELRGC